MAKLATVIHIAHPGRREAKKQEKLLRIRRAAREVFLNKGFHAATVREIAAAADVALGTLFLYANDKQDLLLLIFEEELPVVRNAAFLKASGEMPFVEQLLTFFAEFYRYFNLTPQLSRDMLAEITFGRGMVAERLFKDIENTEHDIARIVARAQANGCVDCGIEPDIAAHIIFSLHRVEVRLCLNQEKPNMEGSLQRLRRQLEVLLAGLEKRRKQDSEQVPRPLRRRS